MTWFNPFVTFKDKNNIEQPSFAIKSSVLKNLPDINFIVCILCFAGLFCKIDETNVCLNIMCSGNNKGCNFWYLSN